MSQSWHWWSVLLILIVILIL
uniref:Uncharacterized protein n=1 Tax=Arundo donax TaxID=35708 RepID=A0A0A9ALD4_ARUDO